jgi:hypothetical protein
MFHSTTTADFINKKPPAVVFFRYTPCILWINKKLTIKITAAGQVA